MISSPTTCSPVVYVRRGSRSSMVAQLSGGVPTGSAWLAPPGPCIPQRSGRYDGVAAEDAVGGAAEGASRPAEARAVACGAGVPGTGTVPDGEGPVGGVDTPAVGDGDGAGRAA